MPPHCDSMDGPVVKAAKMALETGDVNLILPWAPKKAEDELRKSFERTLRARKLGKGARELADCWFFGIAVRLHREGAPLYWIETYRTWGPCGAKSRKKPSKNQMVRV